MLSKLNGVKGTFNAGCQRPLLSCDSLVQFLESPAGFQDVFPVTKSTNPDKAFTSRSKPTTRCRDHMSLLEYLTKDVPRTPAWEMYPHIWGICPSIHIKTEGLERIYYYVSIFFIETNHLLHCLQDIGTQISACGLCDK